MRTISELAKDIKNIYEEILILQDSMEKKDIDIDFKKINATASKNTIKNHYISKVDEYIQKVYFTYLSKVIELTNDDKTKYSQIQFLSRLISSLNNPNFDTKEILLSSVSNKMDLGELVKCISDDLLDVFIVDNLILAYVNGNAENQVIEYVSEIISLFNIDSEKFKQLLNLSKSILNKDDAGILEHSKLSDLNKFLCYMKNPYDGMVVYSLEDAMVEECDKIIVLNVDVENRGDEINLDTFKSDYIVFKGCKFKNIKGISSRNKTVEFNECIFIDNYIQEEKKSWSLNFRCSSDEDNKIMPLIYISKCSIYNCKFENCHVSKELILIDEGCILKSSFVECKGIDVKSGIFLINISKGNINDVKIKECSIKANRDSRGTTILGIIRILYGTINNIDMNSCESRGDSSYGSYATYKSYMILLENSVAEKCLFENCYCTQEETHNATVRNYIIGLSNSSEKGCEFIKCSSYNYNYGDIGSNTNVGEI